MRKSIAMLGALLLVTAGTASAQMPKIKLPVKLPGGVKLPGALGAATDCNQISGDAGLRIMAFLAASVELEDAATKLEGSVKDACAAMAGELGVATTGDTRTLCTRVAGALKAGLRVNAKAKSKTVVTVTPAKCEVTAEARAQASARCAGSASGAAGNGGAAGSTAGACQASGEAQASLNAQCTPPKVDVSSDTSVAVDASGFAKATRAVAVGLPALLAAQAHAKLAAKAAARWGVAAAGLARGGASLAKDFGVQAVCVAGRLAAAAKGAVHVQASLSVSVQASASVSGAAGVH